MRIDKWLWCVRLYKTRSIAAEACSMGKVLLGGQTMKPSKEIKVGDELTINLNPLKKKVKIIGLLNNRIPAKDVPKYYEDLTPQEEYDKIEMMKMMYFERRDAHTGRPTKRDRRDIERFKDSDF
ncbi:MAG: RNA-binding S4 domain-containing protein [Bacteroidales bacterium]|nr:RNA-binding S4 domain-containing protein [Bacteroidales bacterium]